MEFKDRLKEMMRYRDMTAKEIAISTGLSQMAISSYKHGKMLPGYDSLRKMALLFDVSADYLLGLTDVPKGVR